jgi:hypothetical protein
MADFFLHKDGLDELSRGLTLSEQLKAIHG